MPRLTTDDSVWRKKPAASSMKPSREGTGTAREWANPSAITSTRSKNQFPNRRTSILATGATLGIPVTVHVAVGTDIIHMHPAADGAAIGATSLLDFRRLAAVVAGMEGGVYLNIGSAVVLPEVFLKTVSLGRNLGHTLSNITTVNMDFLSHYRPLTNVVRRPTQKGGKGYSLIGHHEIMLPLLVAAVAEELG